MSAFWFLILLGVRWADLPEEPVRCPPPTVTERREPHRWRRK